MRKALSLLLAFELLFCFSGCGYDREIATNKVQTTPIPISDEQTQTEQLSIKYIEKPFYVDMKVHYIDVGQGDCEFIELANGQTMLIDAGNAENGREIVSYVKNLPNQYSNIDFVIATHPHADHIGGMAEVLNSFEIGKMYMPKALTTTETFSNLLNTIEVRGIDLYTAKAGVNITTSENISVDLLAPIADSYSKLNNYSAVVKITYGETVFLFTGDAEQEVENSILSTEVDADILKVGHHGSNTSSSDSFIKAVSPSVAIISCGAGNSYGHPDSETLATLKNSGATIYRTDEVGTITVTADSHKKISIDKKASEIKENAPPASTASQSVTNSNAATQGVRKSNNTTQSTTKSNNNNDTIVYITNTGECYHRNGCGSLSKSKIQTTLSSAKSRGYRACKRCNPPK